MSTSLPARDELRPMLHELAARLELIGAQIASGDGIGVVLGVLLAVGKCRFNDAHRIRPTVVLFFGPGPERASKPVKREAEILHLQCIVSHDAAGSF